MRFGDSDEEEGGLPPPPAQQHQQQRQQPAAQQQRRPLPPPPPAAAHWPPPAAAGPPPPPIASSSAAAVPGGAPRCACSVRVDFNDLSNPCYVFKVARGADPTAIAASVSNHRIKLYGLSGSALTHVGDLTGHCGAITDIGFPIADAPSALLSCSRDGTLRGWDARAGSQAASFMPPGSRQELYTFDVSGHVIAAGGQGSVLFLDRRAPGRPLAEFDDTHMDDVTCVRFHTPSGVLLSASLDGLVAVHDVGAGVYDDEAGFAAALNVGTSVEEVGTYGPAGERLWVRTGTETLHLWDWRQATRDGEPGGDGAFAEATDARAAAGAAAAAAPAAAPFFAQGVDYLAGCHYDAATGQLLLMAGGNEGALGFFPLDERSPGAAPGGAGPGLICPPALVLAGAHESVVRSVQWLGGPGPLCVTGGEDAKLCVWSLEPGAGGAGGVTSSGTSSGPPAPRPKAHTKQQRAAPY